MFGDLKCEFQAWEIPGVLDGHDGLPGNTYGLGQIFLGHFCCIKTQPSNLISDFGAQQFQTPRR